MAEIAPVDEHAPPMMALDHSPPVHPMAVTDFLDHEPSKQEKIEVSYLCEKGISIVDGEEFLSSVHLYGSFTWSLGRNLNGSQNNKNNMARWFSP